MVLVTRNFSDIPVDVSQGYQSAKNLVEQALGITAAVSAAPTVSGKALAIGSQALNQGYSVYDNAKKLWGSATGLVGDISGGLAGDSSLYNANPIKISAIDRELIPGQLTPHVQSNIKQDLNNVTGPQAPIDYLHRTAVNITDRTVPNVNRPSLHNQIPQPNDVKVDPYRITSGTPVLNSKPIKVLPLPATPPPALSQQVLSIPGENSGTTNTQAVTQVSPQVAPNSSLDSS